MGVIPAAGGSVAQWIAYAEEIRRAKPGDQFGKGEVKGLAATEGSNNGVTGTSLVPMFVLGIPGGISAAVILGALMIHGLQPGMRLFKNSPEIIYTIMWGFIFANAIMGFIAVFLARTMAYLTLFPRGLIGPLILIFSVIGVVAWILHEQA
jgi:putative tricarboxylic transport membrane protein